MCAFTSAELAIIIAPLYIRWWPSGMCIIISSIYATASQSKSCRNKTPNSKAFNATHRTNPNVFRVCDITHRLILNAVCFLCLISFGGPREGARLPIVKTNNIKHTHTHYIQMFDIALLFYIVVWNACRK